MREKNRHFGRILSADLNLLNIQDTRFSIRQRDEAEITLYSLSGKILRLVTEKVGNAPNAIVCERLPEIKEPIAEDGWALEDGTLRIPFLTKIELKKVPHKKSVENIEVRDFPGHMKGLISRRIRKADFAPLKSLSERLEQLSLAVREHLTESTEIPLIEVVGFGSGKIAAGDAALCGMLLTGRCFAIGRRFKVTWHSRLGMEIRRLLHRTDIRGKNWLGFALEGRMAESQERFFSAMAKDFECADEIVVRDLSNDESFNGKAFLLGSSIALEMIQNSFFQE